MKKWYLITGILAFLWLVSLSTCSSNSAEVDRLKDELESVNAQLVASKTALDDAEEKLSTLSTTLDDVKAELAQLRATKEISFGNGLKVFDIEKSPYGYEVRGKIKNVSGEPMRKVVVIVAFYNKDGQLDEDWGAVGTYTVHDLFVDEVAEWKVHFGNWSDEKYGLFDVYAIGSKR